MELYNTVDIESTDLEFGVVLKAILDSGQPRVEVLITGERERPGDVETEFALFYDLREASFVKEVVTASSAEETTTNLGSVRGDNCEGSLQLVVSRFSFDLRVSYADGRVSSLSCSIDSLGEAIRGDLELCDTVKGSPFRLIADGRWQMSVCRVEDA